ncbi:hypothetical protein [Xanthomonas campestris]|uniref:hypothetical protein n=1 Tax=Xanthomonas campestris TaxID=339 RepID=UPI0015A4654F|nr:hypothetical protein [Xanthomonas campestris]QLC71458.1 hypothetical protein AD14011_19370 [Xanthomonas campestris pv. raphani]
MSQSGEKIPHRSSKCINCLEAEPNSEEHVFADGAGGFLTAFILCRDCNGKFGNNIDSPYLRQPAIELARNAYRIGGRRNIIPQPLSGPYYVQGPIGQSVVKLDIDFKPRLIPQVEDILVRDDGAIQTTMVIDAEDRHKIPTVVRSKLERFFRSPTGTALGWTKEEQENAIEFAINEYMKSPDLETPVGVLAGSITGHLGTMFLELAKVAFEIAAIEDGDQFIESLEAETIRKLLNQVKLGQIESLESFQDMLEAFRATPLSCDSQLFQVIQALTKGKAYENHVAMLTGRHVVVSMFGDAYIFVNLRPEGCRGAIYINGATNGSVDYLQL